MARPNKDPRFAALARPLNDYKFVASPLDDTRMSLVKMKLMNGQPLKNVAMLPRCRFSVRLSVGGLQRSFAFYNADGFSACRMADLLVFKLGALRYRYAHVIDDSDYNYSEAQAKHDWATNPELHSVFQALTDYLTEINALAAADSYIRRPASEQIIELREQLHRMDNELKILAKAVSKLFS